MAASSSGTTLFQLANADIVAEAFSRIGISGAALDPRQIIEARRSLNLILQDWSANRGLNLAGVDLLNIPLVAGLAQYVLPSDTVQLLDVYRRTFQPGTLRVTVGASLTPVVLMSGSPMVTQFGDPVVLAPGSGTLSSTSGSQIITLAWPSHGLLPGSPIFPSGIMSIGGLTFSGLLVVNTVVDANTVTFISPTPALATQALQGAPPLFTTTSGSATVSVIYPNHALAVGDTFTVPIATTGGGVTLSGDYTVVTVTTLYQFEITAAASATSTDSFFQNAGQFALAKQASGVDVIDTIMGPLSRTDYASIPDKLIPGTPTSFWYDRLQSPSAYIWQVPPAPTSAGQNIYYGMSCYRMRQIQDATLVSGQTPDLPNRYIPSLCAFLCSALAEKFRPEMFQQKMILAEAVWNRTAIEDVEHVPLYLGGDLAPYYR